MRINSTYAFVLLLLLLFVFVLSFTTITKKKIIYVSVVVILISVLGSLFNPIKAYKLGDYTDLYRFYQTLDAIKGLPYNNGVPIFQEYNNFPVMKLLLFIVSRTGINSALPFVACLVFYGIFGATMIKISERYNLTPRIMGLSFFSFICLFNFKMVISNIRCPIGDSIFIFTLFYDIILKPKSKKYWIGYIICCCIHPIFILFTLLKLIIQLTNKYTDKIFFALILAYSFFINTFLDFIGKLTNIEIFEYLSMKIDYYTNLWDVKSNEPLLIVTGILQIIFLIYLLIVARKKIDQESREKRFFKATLSFLIFSISSCWNFVIFQRCTWLLVFFIVYWFSFIKGNHLKLNKNKLTICDALMISMVLFSMASYFLTYQYNVLTF